MTNDNRNKVKINGSWAPIADQFVKVGGTWKTISAIYTKVGGSWKASYPYPVTADTGISAITVNGQSVANGGTVTVAGGTTSVTLAVTTSYASATVSGAVSGTGTATGSVSVSYSGNPNALNFTVTSSDTAHTQNYTVYVTVASSIVVSWAYCVGYNGYTGTTEVIGSNTVTDACNVVKLQKGSPSSWACGSTAQSPTPPCPTPPPPCTNGCDYSYETCGYNSTYGSYGLTVYYTPSAGSCSGFTCATQFYPGMC